MSSSIENQISLEVISNAVCKFMKFLKELFIFLINMKLQIGNCPCDPAGHDKELTLNSREYRAMDDSLLFRLVRLFGFILW